MTQTAPIGPTTHFIDGKWWQPVDRSFPVFNPYDDSVVARIAAGGRDEAEAAIDAAHAAYPAWAAMPPTQRQQLYLNAAEITERRLDEIARIMAIETGASKIFTSFQIRWSVALLRQAANWGFLPFGEVLRSDTPGRFAMVQRKPLGVVVSFTPWNGAFNLAMRAFVLPMAFGNTVVVKPSEEAPMSAGLIHAEIFAEAGFPAGSFNVIAHAPGEVAPIADAIFENRAVRSIFFTGSDKVARILGERAGRSLKRFVPELGGYNPMIVLDDADLDDAVNAAAFGAFFHQGQICTNTRKVYVDAKLHDVFVEKLVAKARSIKMGDPRDPGVILGPLINDAAVDRVEERIADAIARGATLASGGQRSARLFEPTILTHVPHDAVCTTGDDETFGPLLVIESFDDVDQAVAAAQSNRFGLAASIMTADHSRGLEIAERFETGIIHINAATMAGEPSLPNGGIKDSGWGRSGHYAVEDFTEIRLMTMTRGSAHYPI